MLLGFGTDALERDPEPFVPLFDFFADSLFADFGYDPSIDVLFLG